MGIDLGWINENGELLSELVGDRNNLFADFLDSLHLEETKCLLYIDEYGDTIFNQRQIPILINELKDNLKNALSYETQKHVKKMITLAEKSNGESHTFLKFYGD